MRSVWEKLREKKVQIDELRKIRSGEENEKR